MVISIANTDFNSFFVNFTLMKCILRISLKLAAGIVFIGTLSMNPLKAQDIHLSQYYASPLNLSPALTGDFDGDYRFVGNFRNQWASITSPYRTFGFSVDAKGIFKTKNVHTGLSVISDEAGDSEFGTTLVNFSIAISYPFDLDSNHIVSFGLQPGFAQRKMNFNNLTFDNQYSLQLGRYDGSLASGENFATNSISYFNLGAGLSYTYMFGKYNRATSGVSVYNLVNPRQSFFKDENVKLNQRLTLHSNAQIRMGKQVDLLPGISYMKQGKYNEFILGSSGRYLLNGFTSLHLGYWYRNKDAGYITGGITYQSLYIGTSYDINTSSLKTVSRGRGGFEFSIIYILRKFDGKLVKHQACPSFI